MLNPNRDASSKNQLTNREICHTPKSALCCLFQLSKWCKRRCCRSERFSSILKGKPAPPTVRPSQPFTQPSLPHSILTSSSPCSAEQRTGERHKHGTGRPAWHKAPHLTVAEQKRATDRSVLVCACMPLYVRVFVCVLFTELFCHMSSSSLSIPSLFFSSVAKPAWGRDTLCRFHPLA